MLKKSELKAPNASKPSRDLNLETLINLDVPLNLDAPINLEVPINPVLATHLQPFFGLKTTALYNRRRLNQPLLGAATRF